MGMGVKIFLGVVVLNANSFNCGSKIRPFDCILHCAFYFHHIPKLSIGFNFLLVLTLGPSILRLGSIGKCVL